MPARRYKFFGFRLNDTDINVYPTRIPIKEGYKFLGWAKTKDAVEPNVTPDTVVDKEEITYYAVWKEDKVKVQFNPNGGEDAPNFVEVTRNKRLGAAFPDRKPTREGYVFLGWAKSKYAYKPDFFSDTDVNDDMTVYAVWKKGEKQEVTVRFSMNGGNGSVDSVTVEKGATLGDRFPKDKPTRDGYVFRGWSVDENAEKADFFPHTIVNDNMTIYAVWKKKDSIEEVKVTFRSNAGGDEVIDMPEAVTVDRGDILGESFPKEEPKRDGYIFLGWSEDSSSSVPTFFSDSIVNDNMDVFAIWRSKGEFNDPVTVYFDTNGGKGSFVPVTVESGTSLGEKFPEEKPKKDGYRFKGWSRSIAATEGDFTKDSIVGGNWIVYAVYEKVENVTPGDQPKPEGYVTVIFDFDGKGTSEDMLKFHVDPNKNVNLEAPEVTPNPGLKFTGWNKRTQGKFTEDTTITAQYRVLKDVESTDQPRPAGYAKITFDKGLYGLTLLGETSFYVKIAQSTVDLSDFAPTAIGQPGYSFNGWDRFLNSTFYSDTTITAMWKPESRNSVTYRADGKILDVEYVNSGERPTEVPDAPEKEGYEFVGWQKDGTEDVYTPKAVEKIEITGDTEFDAKYEKIESAAELMVTFEVSGKIISIEKVAKGSRVANVPDDPVAGAGRTFIGWRIGKKAGTYTKEAVKAFVIKKNTAFVAIFNDDNVKPSNPSDPPEAGYVKVTFDKGEHGESLKGISVFKVRKGVTVNLSGQAPEVVPKEGYRYDGWDNMLHNIFEEDTVITAIYQKQEDVIIPKDPDDPVKEGYVKITFDKGKYGKSLDGEEVLHVRKGVDVDLTYEVPKVIAKDGWQFKEWDKPIVGKFSSNTTITATYEKEDNVIVPEYPSEPPKGYVEVRFEKGVNGESLEGDTVFHVKKNKYVRIKAPLAVAEEGFKFTEWDISPNGRFKKNTVITAKYEPTTGHRVLFKADGKIVGVYYVRIWLQNVHPEAPEKSGYTFIGWQRDGIEEELYDNFDSGMLITHDSVFTAIYKEKEKQKHVVTFESRGQILSWGTVEHGKQIGKEKIPEVPTPPTPYTFIGWKIEGKSGIYLKEALEDFVINEETHFIAHMEPSNVIVPMKPDEMPAPGYVKVTFDKGEHGQLRGHNVFQIIHYNGIDLTPFE